MEIPVTTAAGFTLQGSGGHDHHSAINITVSQSYLAGCGDVIGIHYRHVPLTSSHRTIEQRHDCSSMRASEGIGRQNSFSPRTLSPSSTKPKALYE